MMKKPLPDVSLKSTKDQILSAYHEVLEKLKEKPIDSPQVLQTRQEEKTVVTKASAHSPEAIVADLSGLKLKTIKQLDGLSEELLGEFQKLSELRQAVVLEQQHLEDLYEIKETAHTLAVLLQAHTDQKEKLEEEREQQNQDFEAEITSQRFNWEAEKEQQKRDFQEAKNQQKKDREREEEEYVYTRDLQRRKEMDDHHAQNWL
jgi:hypothetical protein